MQKRIKNTRVKPGARATAKTSGRTLKERTTTVKMSAKGVARTGSLSPRKKSVKKTTYFIKKRARKVVYDFYVISVIFLTLVMLSSAFLLYQWKNYKIVEYGKEVQQLRAEIYRLNGEIRPKQAMINRELTGHKRITRIASEKLGLKPSTQGLKVFSVDKAKLEYYARKDMEEK